MKITRFLAAIGVALLFATQAYAADTCSIREYSSLGGAQGSQAQIAQEPAVTDQVTPDFTSGVQQSAAFNALTSYIAIVCNVQTSYLIGTNPTAAATNFWIPAATVWIIGVPLNQGYKISVHTNP